MKATWMIRFAMMIALCVATTTSAQTPANSFTPEEAAQFTLPSLTFGVSPVPGVYFDPAQSGTGFTSDTVVANGVPTFFATYYHYTANGDPTWMNILGPIVQSSLTSYAADGVPAKVTGPFQRVTGGQCFDCAYVAPANVATPHGNRSLDIVDGRWIRMPASGNAAERNMHLARVFTSQAALNSALLESGAVWQCKQRHYWQGVENGSASGTDKSLCGWLRFERRAPNMNWRYVAPVTTTWIQDGQGGHLASTQPAWLAVNDLNSIAVQYQLEAVLFNETTIGSWGNPYSGGLKIEQAGATNAGATTIIVNPANGNIHAVSHCIGCTSGPSFNRDNAGVTEVGQFVWAGVDGNGQERLIVRMWSRYLNAFVGEIELTRVPEALRKQLLPNYVPSAEPR